MRLLLKMFKNTVLLFVLVLISCGNSPKEKSLLNTPIKNQVLETSRDSVIKKPIVVGANKTQDYFPKLTGKTIGIVANQTSVIFNENDYTHIVDSLYNSNINIKAVFAPEHGFRGKADAGEIVKDGIDTKTGLPIVSLYGNNKKPTPEQLQDIDLIVFDIQDVGARFYTYISTLHYVMEACAENNISVLVLDRPNPNGHYIDGPILEPEYKSFVGMHPVPIVHGMTIGEYAQMINGEGWLKNGVSCGLSVIKMINYSHKTPYSLPIKPSPNLPTDQAINLYPSLCFFEGTNVNAGRGTKTPFEVFGSPFLSQNTYTYTYTPQSNDGAKYPKHKDVLCYGKNLSHIKQLNHLDLNYLIEAYNNTSDQTTFFNSFFTKLAGTKTLQKQIEDGLTVSEIKKTWALDLNAYEKMRKPYLLYN
ncbi:exo-beta-N-acetylmuramidase NamZ family protein [Mangrovimonas spongiae]|uniref:DUF1343 domain-containing protein n=1 Tax=Mangrovimonas spongiae TaxID=2494697 RepID=A0A3R9MFG6_9FLAO|nr:DUF1343 domain-containing protein [Mangrovimonas spongiae]RSK39182.1 DUF1343 domain-containing protein [Mangrovimonas spongiae]